MHDPDPDIWGKLGFGLYCLIGLPIAWHFMRQQAMTASSQQSGLNRYVVMILAMMWPILLFAMGVNYLLGTGKSKAGLNRKKSDAKDEPRSQPPPV